MLGELTDLQESDERVWGMTDLSFSINTRSEDGKELIERTYVFGHAKEWDKWVLQQYREKRTPDTIGITSRNWRTTEQAKWSDPAGMPSNISVPEEVMGELKRRLGVDSIHLQDNGE